MPLILIPIFIAVVVGSPSESRTATGIHSPTPDSVDPECISTKTGEYRSITTMSNIFGLLSKIVLGKIKPALVETRIISENQVAFVEDTVGANELVLLDEVIQGQYNDKLDLTSKKRSTVFHTHTYMC